MIKTKRRGLKVGLALTVSVMLMLSLVPGGSVTSPKVEAYGENEDGTLYYAETWLYDYRYDTEVGSYNYDHDNQIAYKLNGGDKHVMSQEECHNLKNGDRWMTGLQVPYEKLNRKISDFYSSKNGSIPALYFGNFLGTATNLDDSRGNNEGQTPWQYTYKDGVQGNSTYPEAYTHYWQSANNAPKNNNGNVAVQGLIDRTLNDNGLPTQNSGAFELPQFSDSFISANSNLMQKYETGDGFPFNIINNADGTKTYEFDSANDAPRYYQDGSIKIGTTDSNGVANWRSDGNSVTAGGYGFFPFNSYSIKNTEIGRNDVNYGFGMKVNIPFSLSENGTILDKDDNEVDVRFSFSGDDDVWVFIDGVLVLDIGGDHAKVSGNINFNRNSQQVYISQAATFSSSDDRYKKIERSNTGGAQTTTLKNMFQAANVAFNENEFYNPRTEHTLTVFYMERGMFESNLSISFNFAPVKPVNPHQLTVKEQTVFENVNQGLLTQTVAVADKDIFNYSIENQNTDPIDVTDSGLSVPTYDYIDRNNTEEGNSLRNRLSGQQEVYEDKTSRTFDSDHIYIQPGSDWTKDGRQIAAWAWKVGVSGSSHYVVFTYDSDTGYYKANRDECDRMKLVCYSSGTAPAEGSTNWESTGKVDEWGHDIEIPVDKNVFICSSDSWSDKTVENVTTTHTLKQETHNFEPSGNDYNTVSNTTYQLTDPFGIDTNTSQTKTTLNRDTTDDGHFGLMYGEEAYFAYQFGKDSNMRVKQEDALLQPMDNRAETMGSQTGTRSVSDYYNTTVNVVDIDNTTILSKNTSQFDRYNTADGTYVFANAQGSTSETIHLTETYINTIKVGAVEVSKQVSPVETNGQVFTFKVTLSNLFGDETEDGIVTDYDDVVISIDGQKTTLESDGTFTITADQAAVLTGIPVRTSCLIEEVLDEDSYYRIHDQSSRIAFNGIIEESTEYSTNSRGNVINTRKVGKLKVTKSITGDGADKSDTFPVTVTLTAPEGVSLQSYISRNYITIGGNVQNFSIDLPEITFDVTDGSEVTIGNIPYGTTYEVNETPYDYVSDISFSDSQMIINQSGEDTVSIVNTKLLPDIATIVIEKIDNYNQPVNGADFKIYLNRADAAAKNNNTVQNVTVSVSRDGTVFTFEQLAPNTTYYISETTVPKGYTGLEAPLEVKTDGKQSVKTVQAVNNKIEIVMPETGGTPFLIDFSVIGVFAVGLAAIALVIYKRKLQSEASYADEKEV